MSLRGFHLLFMALSIATAGFFAIWAFEQYRVEGSAAWVAAGVIALACAGLLAVYAWAFRRKTLDWFRSDG